MFSKGSSNSGTTLRGGAGGEKATFTSFEVRKTSRSVSTHFVADCSFTRILKRVFGGGNGDGGSLGGGGEGGKPSLLPFVREKPWASLKQGLV